MSLLGLSVTVIDVIQTASRSIRYREPNRALPQLLGVTPLTYTMIREWVSQKVPLSSCPMGPSYSSGGASDHFSCPLSGERNQPTSNLWDPNLAILSPPTPNLD
ncbi:hypothetical protein HAX54_000248 [Datura stramonium]|uniref:Uncharacterized protein n=1 Tax=Datura stramonium TaxID=4076 RepID=A0ABS8T1H8_DATST|nr:hypothetical protein [Datura stramonium]